MAKAKKKTVKSRPTQAANTYPSWLTNSRLHKIVLFSLSFFCYINTTSLDYALDDAIVIHDNMFTTDGVSGIDGILSKDTFFGFFKEEGKSQLVAGGRYRPLSLVTFALEWELFAKKAGADNEPASQRGRPWISHLLNTLLFGATIVLLYSLLLLLFKIEFPPSKAAIVALVTTALFAVHPIHTEAVANIKGRDEILALMGSLAALYFTVKAKITDRWLFHLLAGIVFFLALMSKENAITFLAVVPLSLYFFTPTKIPKIISALGPYVVASAIFLTIRFSILGVSIGDPPMELMNNPFLKIENNQWIPFSPAERSATITFTLGKYIQLLVFPHPLSHDYYPRQVDIMSWGDWQVILSLLLYLGMIAYALFGLKRRDPISYAILFFLATISIASNIVFPIGTNMSERLIFMPSLAFCLLIGVLSYRLLARNRLPLKTLVPVLGVIIALLSLKTITRNYAWKNNYKLFTTDIEVAPNSAKLRNATGGELVAQSQKPENQARKDNMLQEALGHLEEAVRIHPTYKNAWLLKGNAHLYLKQYEAAISSYQQSLNVDPDYTEANNNLGIAFTQAGQYYGEQANDLSKALNYLQQAFQLRPNDFQTIRLLGVASGMSGNSAEAIRLFTKCTVLQPNNASAWFDLGVAHLNAQDESKANEAFAKAKSIDPDIESKRAQ
ncbi:MAG: tetratricopeptide repeat protein [Saprospiraceae bacterium]|nr:tetratricopeptide repeat protein [Saprospiraceae bacterium]